MINKRLLVRLGVICFFMGVNVVLGARFLREARLRLPKPLVQGLTKYGLIPSTLKVETIKTAAEYQAELDPRDLAHSLNSERIKRGLPELIWNPALATAAAQLLEESSLYDYDFDKYSINDRLGEAVTSHGYDFQWVSQSTLVGPLTKDAIVDAWLSEDSFNEGLLEHPSSTAATDVRPIIPKDVGFAVVVADTDQYGTVGVVVQLMGTPRPQMPSTSSVKSPSMVAGVAQPTPITFPEISDTSVQNALNEYRAAHGHAPLKEASELCAYAQKRVEDLVAFGGLDGHEGFKQDFADGKRPPQLEHYAGTQIGENLAYQYCRNMTTGDSFVAQNGTELIEWCFDSSTKGHREAQLSTDFKNVCVRHGDQNYVVTFGN